MSTTPVRLPARLLPAALAVLALALAALTLPPAAVAADDGTTAPATTQPLGTTTFRVASINLLGAGHTDGRNPRRGFAKSPARLRLTLAIMNREKITVAGLQEMHHEQAVQWERDMSASWGLYPGTNGPTRAASHNSITWRKDLYTVVRRALVNIPYFNGRETPMPYVLLRHRQTGQQFWLLNVHNPANSAGPAQRHRDEAVRRQAALINKLRQESPTTPVLMTGDMNDRAAFFCPIVAATGIAAANGGFSQGSTCTPPPKMRVDWVMGTTDATFTGYRDLQDASVKRASDHPFIIADANIASAQMAASPINRVVTIAVAGLRGKVITNLGPGRLPNLNRLLETGSGTLDARNAPESSRSMPNLVSLLSGQRVDRAAGGHGVTTDADKGGTTHALAGRFVPTVLSLAHNLGRRTTFVSSAPRSALVIRSYDRTNGGGDPYGRDNGTNKIDNGAIHQTDGQVFGALNAELTSARPSVLSVAELTGPERAGFQSGFNGRQYTDALIAVDRLIGRTMRTIRTNPTLAGRTLLVVTGTSGGTGSANGDRMLQANYRVPILVSGPGVQAGGDLYAMNPLWTSPRGARSGYGQGPIYLADVANLITGALKLPPLPGSQFNRAQRLSPWQS